MGEFAKINNVYVLTWAVLVRGVSAVVVLHEVSAVAGRAGPAAAAARAEAGRPGSGGQPRVAQQTRGESRHIAEKKKSKDETKKWDIRCVKWWMIFS